MKTKQRCTCTCIIYLPVTGITMYLLKTIIGDSVSMFRANDTKLRRWVTVFEWVSLMSFIGSAISTDHVSSLFLRKIWQFCYNHSEKWYFDCIVLMPYKYCILTPSLVISIMLLLTSLVCSCRNFVVKGVTCFDLVAVGSHVLA